MGKLQSNEITGDNVNSNNLQEMYFHAYKMILKLTLTVIVKLAIPIIHWIQKSYWVTRVENF